MYNGIEIDMLSLGDADCILVSFWNGTRAYRVLIDAGNKCDAPKVRAFLRGLNISTVDEVLATHPHDDHMGGLAELLSDTTLQLGKLWCHIPHLHVESMEKVNNALRAAGTSEEANRIQKSLETAEAVYGIAQQRQIFLEEPFEGKKIGILQVLSPSVGFYEDLVSEFTEPDRIKAEDEAELRYRIQGAVEEGFAKNGLVETGSLLDDPHTSPENESSVVTGFTHAGSTVLFTADAGLCALTNVIAAYAVAGLGWMQIPHHGSRRNLNKCLIETFAPKTAFVSAIGNDKHPRRAVVNAFKNVDTKVYSTHYPSPAHKRFYMGSVPPRVGYITAVPLWDAKQLAKAQQDVPSLADLLLGVAGTR